MLGAISGTASLEGEAESSFGIRLRFSKHIGATRKEFYTRYQRKPSWSESYTAHHHVARSTLASTRSALPGCPLILVGYCVHPVKVIYRILIEVVIQL